MGITSEISRDAIKAAVLAAGGPSRLAEKLGCTPSAVCQWVRRGAAPDRRVIVLEALTGIPRERLRPDLYPSDQKVERIDMTERPF